MNEGEERSLELWKNPAVVGPIVAALIAAVVAVIALIPDSDRTPPPKPVIVDISRVSGDVTQLVLVYEGGGDGDSGSGLKEVRLWYRLSNDDRWTKTRRASTAPKGEIYFSEPQESGLYFFDLVAMDQAGNKSAEPTGTDGQRRFQFQDRVKVEAMTTGKVEPQQQGVEAILSSAEPPIGWAQIPVYFHMVGQEQVEDSATMQINEQISVLNRAFFPGKIAFSLAGLDAVPASEWNELSPGSTPEKEMKRALSKLPASQLNVYVTTTNGGILSWSTFPWDLTDNPDVDGCVMRPENLPGGDPPFDQGKTLVHCVGHWLGLYHTFQGGCEGPGDFVEDTPAHASPNFGRPVEAAACKPDETAPIDNYMNYTDDSVQKGFTAGQYSRMRKAIAAYRMKLL